MEEKLKEVGSMSLTLTQKCVGSPLHIRDSKALGNFLKGVFLRNDISIKISILIETVTRIMIILPLGVQTTFESTHNRILTIINLFK